MWPLRPHDRYDVPPPFVCALRRVKTSAFSAHGREYPTPSRSAARKRVLECRMPMKKAKCEAAAQRRPAESERKNCVFSAKRQAVWFETQNVSN